MHAAAHDYHSEELLGSLSAHSLSRNSSPIAEHPLNSCLTLISFGCCSRCEMWFWLKPRRCATAVCVSLSILITAATHSRRSPPPVLTGRRHPIALNAATRSRWSPPALCCGCGHHLRAAKDCFRPKPTPKLGFDFPRLGTWTVSLAIHLII